MQGELAHDDEGLLLLERDLEEVMERGEAEQDDAISGEGIVAEDDADAAHPQPSTASAGQHTSDHEDDDSIDDDAPTLSVHVAEVGWVVLRHLRSTIAAIVAERLADIASARDAAQFLQSQRRSRTRTCR